MAAQNEPNFPLFTSSDLDFPTNLLLKWSFEQNRQKLRNKQDFNGFACVVYVRFARMQSIQCKMDFEN